MEYRYNKISFIKEIRAILQVHGEIGSLTASKAIADWIIKENIVTIDPAPVLPSDAVTIHCNSMHMEVRR